MGVCQSANNSKSNKNITNHTFKSSKTFSISQYGRIIPNQKLNSDLTFLVHIRNFRLRNVKDNHKYFIYIDFPYCSKSPFILKLSNGPLAKFSFDESFKLSLPFEMLEKSVLKLVSIYHINIHISI